MKYNWDEDTVDHFKFESYYESREKIEQRIKEFVELDCIPEDGETEEDLVSDLIGAVYTDGARKLSYKDKVIIKNK